MLHTHTRKKKNQPYWSLGVYCQEGGVRITNCSLGYTSDFLNMLALVSFWGLPKLFG